MAQHRPTLAQTQVYSYPQSTPLTRVHEHIRRWSTEHS